MQYHLLFIALMSFGTLACTKALPSQDFRVLYANQQETENVPAKTTLKVLTSDLSAALGEASSNSIAKGHFANLPLTFDTDSQGAGNVTYGKSSYRISFQRKYSGGILCTRMYSTSNFLVDCTIPWKGLEPLTESSRVVKRNIASLRADFGLEVLPVLPELAYEEVPFVCTETNSSLAKRAEQTPPDCSMGSRKQTQNKDGGDGFPHQNYYHVQQSERMACDGHNNCAVTHGAIHTRTVKYSFNMQPFEWINGGYAVEKSLGTKNDYICGGGPHDEVCAWYNMAHTAYTVETIVQACGKGIWKREGPEQIIKSPNASNRGGRHYCVLNTCRSINDDWWDNNERAGGPK